MFTFEGWEFDSRRLVLSRAGSRICVRPKALLLLQLLIENRDRIVTYEEIRMHLWHGCHVEPQGLSVLLSGLRKVLGDSQSNPIIVTVPNAGCRFVAKLAVPFAASRSSTPHQSAIYLKSGRELWNTRRPDALAAAMECFELAALSDPKSPLAYVGIADTLTVRLFYGSNSNSDDWGRAKLYGWKAIDLDEGCGQAYASLGRAAYLLRQWRVADFAFVRCLELAPDYPAGHQWYSNYLFAQGRFDDALFHAREAVKLRPGALELDNLGHLLFYNDEPDEALRTLHLALAEDSNFAPAHCFRGLLQASKGNWDEAIASCNVATSLNSSSLFFQACLAYALAKAGMMADASNIGKHIARLTVKDIGVREEALALIAWGLNRLDDSASALHTSLVAGSPWVLFGFSAPIYQSMHEQAQFRDLRNSVMSTTELSSDVLDSAGRLPTFDTSFLRISAAD